MRTKVLALALVLVAGQHAVSLAQTRQWLQVAPPGGKCFVKMPTKPEVKSETVDSKHGKYTTHMFLSRTDAATYLLAWVDYAPDFHPDVQAEIEANRDNFLKGVEANVTSERKISLTETLAEKERKLSLVHPGIEFTAESPTSMFRSRVYMVGDRPYQLLAVWAKGKEEPPGIVTFLASFRLEKHESKGVSGPKSHNPTSHPSAAPTEDDITGSYAATGKSTKGVTYQADVFISKKGNAYTIRWVLNGVEFIGVGLRQGDYLAVAYEQSENNAGVCLYHIVSKSTLIGKFTTQEAGGKEGTETLTRARP